MDTHHHYNNNQMEVEEEEPSHDMEEEEEEEEEAKDLEEVHQIETTLNTETKPKAQQPWNWRQHYHIRFRKIR